MGFFSETVALEWGFFFSFFDKLAFRLKLMFLSDNGDRLETKNPTTLLLSLQTGNVAVLY